MGVNNKFDVVIVGGGMVGLTLALALSDFKVALIEAHKFDINGSEQAPTARVCAINQASKQFLQNLSLWSMLNKKRVSQLQELFVWDGVGGGEIQFDAASMGLRELGFIVDNREIIKNAWHQLQENKNVEFFIGLKPVSLTKMDQCVEITLSDKTNIKAALCVGADGANSWVREQIYAQMNVRSYHQDAIIAVVETQKSHEHIGWQVFLPNGPLALLPLAHPHRCAIVWSNKTSRAKALIAMNKTAFEYELNNAFGFRLGEIKYISDKRAFPLVKRHATHYVESRIALAGDAAHTIHPLAGQGVNLGFKDVAVLAECLQSAKAKHQDIACLRTLRRYERWRKGENTEMIIAMRALNDLFLSASTALVQMRSQGFNFVNRSTRVKQFFMKTALGNVPNIP